MTGSAGYAIVTGGGSGIGRAIALRLGHAGWNVAVADIAQETAAAVAGEIGDFGGAARGELLDVADPESWEALRERLAADWPRLDLLVNGAGTLLTGVLETSQVDHVRRLIDVNLLGTIWGCRTMVGWIKTSGPREIAVAPAPGVMNIASIFGVVSPPCFSAYNASKAGVIALTETLRGELAPAGLNATVVVPGVVPTALFDRAVYSTDEQAELCRGYLRRAEITAEMVAEQAIRAASKRKLYAVVGRRAAWYWRLKCVAPSWLIDKVGRRGAKELMLGGDENQR